MKVDARDMGGGEGKGREIDTIDKRTERQTDLVLSGASELYLLQVSALELVFLGEEKAMNWSLETSKDLSSCCQ